MRFRIFHWIRISIWLRKKSPQEKTRLLGIQPSYKRIDKADIITKLIANAHSDVSRHLLDWRIEGNHEKNWRNLVAVEYQPTQLGQQNVSNRRGSAEIQRYCFRYNIFREIYPAMQHSIYWNRVWQASQMTPQNKFRKELSDHVSLCYWKSALKRRTIFVRP